MSCLPILNYFKPTKQKLNSTFPSKPILSLSLNSSFDLLHGIRTLHSVSAYISGHVFGHGSQPLSPSVRDSLPSFLHWLLFAPTPPIIAIQTQLGCCFLPLCNALPISTCPCHPSCQLAFPSTAPPGVSFLLSHCPGLISLHHLSIRRE